MTSYKPPYRVVPIFNEKDWETERTTLSTTSTSLDPLYDAFGRLRVSEPANRYDVESTYDKQPLLTEEVISGNSTITHQALGRDILLEIKETANGSGAILASSYNTPYTPGCSQIIDITGVMDYAGIGGGTMSIFKKFAGNTTTYTQNTWTNYSNASTCDWTKSHIFSIDFQSLKVGTIRFFLVREGRPRLVHYISNDNLVNTGYWQHPNMRPYWRIYNSSNTTITEIGYGGVNNGVGFRYTLPTANASASMTAICATVKSEGGLDIFSLPGFPFATSNYTTSVSVGATMVPILSIKPLALFNTFLNRTLVIVEEISIVNDNPILFRVLLNPTLANTSFSTFDSNSIIQKDVSANSVSGGTIIDEDYASTGLTRSSSTRQTLGRTILSGNWSGTDADILTIAGIRTTNTSAATTARIRWREIR